MTLWVVFYGASALSQTVTRKPDGYVQTEVGCTWFLQTPTQPVGGLSPDPTSVALHEEDVHIAVVDHVHMRTKVRYLLSSPFPVERLRASVPFATTVDVDPETPAPEIHAASRERAVGAVRVVAGGRVVPCVAAGAQRSGERPEHLEPWTPSEGSPTPDGTCAVDLSLPPGHTEVILEYESLLIRDDAIHSGWDDRARTIYFLPGSHTGWGSTPRRAGVTVDRGPLRGLVRPAEPAGARLDGNTLTWSIDTGTAPPPAILAVVDVPARLWWLRMLEATGGPDDWVQSATATASSTLSSDGRYAAGYAVDRDPTTAWCEGADGPGIGEAIELRFPVRADSGLAVLGGHAKDDATWRGNHRLKRIAVEACDDLQTRAEFDLTPSEERLGGVATVWFRGSSSADRLAASMHAAQYAAIQTDAGLLDPRTGPAPPQEACLRVTLLQVEPGSRWDDTCISEIRPFHWEAH